MTGLKRREADSLAYYVTASVLALAFLVPLFYIAFRSFLPATADAKGIGPQSILDLTLSNYQTIFRPEVGLWQYVANSMTVAIATAALVSVAATFAGYAISHVKFRFSGIAFLLVLAPLFVPFQGLLTPLSLVLAQIHLLNSLAGVVLVISTFQLPFAVFVMRNSFEAVPQELREAAAIDGAGLFGILFRVLLPLAWPGVVTIALFAFMAGWNDLLTSVVFLSDQSKYTLPIVLTSIPTTLSFGVAASYIDPGLLTATACIATAPVVVLFIIFQKYYAQGLIGGSLK
jgi:multiple sugar transport system permease protein